MMHFQIELSLPRSEAWSHRWNIVNNYLHLAFDVLSFYLEFTLY